MNGREEKKTHFSAECERDGEEKIILVNNWISMKGKRGVVL